jgi:hypothetical protein
LQNKAKRNILQRDLQKSAKRWAMSLWAFRLPIGARRHVAKPVEILSFDVWIDLQVEIDRFYVLVGQDNFVVVLRD